MDHRWIISPAGDVDPVWDRTDAIGPDHRRRELLDYLAARIGDTPHQKARELLKRSELSRSDDAL